MIVRKRLRLMMTYVGVTFLFGPGAQMALAGNDTLIKELRREIKENRKQMVEIEKKLNQVEENRKRLQMIVEENESKGKAVKPKNEKKTTIEKQENIRVHGSVKFSYRYQEHKGKAHRDRGGDAKFDDIKLDFDGEKNDVIFDARYELNTYSHFIRHAYIGYRFSENWQVDAGILQVPFGNLPYASNDYWFGIPYYIGLEDDYDIGLKLNGTFDDWNMKVAFFKNGEYGDPTRVNRYSLDVLKDAELNQYNSETNQFNFYLTRKMILSEKSDIEFGGSAQWGQLYNESTYKNGDHWATALHLSANHGPFNLILEGIRFEHNPKNPAGVSNDSILMGGQGGSYLTVAKGWIWDANISYKFPVKLGPITSVTLYEDYSILDKDPAGWISSQTNTLGAYFQGEGFYIRADYTMGKNKVWISNTTIEPTPMTTGTAGAGWNNMFLLFMGFYF